MTAFLKNNWSTLLLLAAFGLLMIPQTGLPIRVFVQRLIMMAPSEVPSEEQKEIVSYDWTLKLVDGGEVNFLSSKERVALVNFWATWCPPCVAELPSMQGLYELYGDKVDFYFVTMEDPKKVARFMEKKGYTFPVYIEIQSPPKELLTTTIPTTFLISSTGSIVIEKTGAAQWDSQKVQTKLDTLLESKVGN